MSTTYSTTITVGGVAQSVGALNASTSMLFSNGGTADPIYVAVNGLPASAQNGIIVQGNVLVDAVGSNSGLWPILSNKPFSIFGPLTNQPFTVTYT